MSNKSIEKTAGFIQQWVETFFHQSLNEFFSYGRTHDLSMSQLGVMFHLYHRRSCNVSQIAAGLGITKAAVSQLLDGLEKQGLITRKEDKQDRRIKHIELTDNGKKTIKDIMNAKKRWFLSLATKMSREEQEVVTHGLSILMEKAEEKSTDDTNS